MMRWEKDDSKCQYFTNVPKCPLTAERLRSLPIPKIYPSLLKTANLLSEGNAKEIKGSGNITIRANIDPETFTDWCTLHGFQADSRGEISLC